MTEQQVKAEQDRIMKEAEDKAKKEAARLKTINKLIRNLSPGTAKKTRKAFGRLYTAHKDRLQTIADESREKARKAKATRTFTKIARAAKLNKENKEVAKILMEEKFPLDVAIHIAKDRHDLQKHAAQTKKKKRALENKLRDYRSSLSENEKSITVLQDDIDGMRSRNVREEWVSRAGHKFANASGWLWINMWDSQRQLRDAKQKQKDLKKKITEAEAQLKTK